MILIVHVLAGAAAWSSMTGIPLAVVLLGAAISAVWHTSDALRWRSSSIAGVHFGSDGELTYIDRLGRRFPVQRLRVTWISRWATVIGMRAQTAGIRWLVLLPDAASPAAMGQFRVWLSWRDNSKR